MKPSYSFWACVVNINIIFNGLRTCLGSLKSKNFMITDAIYLTRLQKIQVFLVNTSCTTIHRFPIFTMRYSVLCKVYTEYHGTNEIEHGLCACTVDNPLAKARGLSLRTGAQTILYLSLVPQSTDTQSLTEILRNVQGLQWLLWYKWGRAWFVRLYGR